MKKTILVLLLLCEILGGKLLAQENAIVHTIDDYRSLGLAVGLNTGSIQDLHFSPLIYQELGPIYHLNYRRKRADKKHLFTTDLTFTNGQATTNASDSLKAKYIMPDINVSYLRQLTNSNNNIVLLLGGAYQLDFNQLIFNNVLESFTFLIAHSIDLKGQIRFPVNKKHQFSSSLSLPILALLVRPPYIGYDDELIANQERPLRLITNGDFVSLNKYARLTFDVKYSCALNDHWIFESTYVFNHLRHEEYKQFQNQLLLGLNYNF